MVRRTVDLLPEIFRTDTNKKFLGATLDQLTQEPNLKRTQGFVGRRIGPGVNPADNYISEPSAVRTDYQLEPGVIFLKPQTNQAIDAITYPGIIDALSLQGADVTRQDRLMQSEFYSWDAFCDLDKFVNYSQYYWMPSGPDSVDIAGTAVSLTDAWTVDRTDVYRFSDIAGTNPTITLARGGNYTFEVNQPGHAFWIQAAPGISGTLPATPNISSRQVLGVENNGEDGGTVTFRVPLKTEQDFYYTLTNIGPVDLITNLKFNQLNNVYVSEFLRNNPSGIDGITELDGRTVVFTNTIEDAEDGGWQITSLFDPLTRTTSPNDPAPQDGETGSFDTISFDQTTDITPPSRRYSVWQIRYVNDILGNPYMQLESVVDVANLSKFTVRFGTVYSSTQWYKNAEGFFEQIPLLTAIQDVLWYQDGSNPEIFGRIRLVEQGNNVVIDFDEIVGAQNYVSPNGVTFTNGLKVQIRGLVNPPEYQDLEFYVEGVGTGPGVDLRVGFVDGEAYFGPYHVYQGKKMTGAVHSEDTFQQYIYDTLAESLLNIGAGGPEGAPLPVDGVAGSNQGNGIKLIPVTDFVTPESYTRSNSVPYSSTPYDNEPYDANLNSPRDPDYLTINRASKSKNAWSRSNRWFHIDVIRATAAYNNQVVTVDNQYRAKRPIVEFRPNLNLFNTATQGKQAVNIIDFSETDAFTNIVGTRGYSTDGYTFINGSRVIFASDTNPAVRNQIWEVQFIDPESNGNLVIDLRPTVNGQVLINQGIVCISGDVQKGKSFWFDGVNWKLSQEKTRINQAPLFDVVDASGVSFGNSAVYPSTTFKGSRLFGYADTSSQLVDETLGFALRYLNINNVGDIVFQNYFYTDTFVYVQDGIGQEQNVSTGFVKESIDRVSFTEEIGWQTAATDNNTRQVFRFNYNGDPLILDVAVDEQSLFAPLQIFVEGSFIDPDTYSYTVSSDSTNIVLNTTYPTGTIVEVLALSQQASKVAFYQVPANLENNPLNENSNQFTLGTIRTHYESIGQNLKTLKGDIIGANNTRDLGNILRYGDIIVQQSSPLTLTGVTLRQPAFEFFNALRFNSREYTRYKALLMDQAVSGDYVNQTPAQILDSILIEISLGRSEISPFYWSDMIPSGSTYIENSYTYSFISSSTFDTVQTYNFEQSNFQGLLVYLNDKLLTKDYEYTVSPDSPNLTITVPLATGDKIVIREYQSTYGSFVPNTPTKMGLYPSFKPEIYVDNTYIQPRAFIRGHDGSVTAAFGDFRDQVLLEFETRIFNNLKIQSAIPLTAADVVPGQFRSTEYNLTEINDILVEDFLSWVGWNKLEYTSQDYISTNAFTYNYSQSSNKLTRDTLVGAWRGIYNYFYDTNHPHTRPWEMLGLSQEPDWWVDEYGPGPYTSGNTVLWDDLAQGFIKDPVNPRIDPRYARPQLLKVLPVDSEGNLLPPIDTVVGNYDALTFKRSWAFGDDGPTENAWRTSSSWPFAVMRLLALTKPAQFFSLFADRDRYVFDSAIGQYLWDGRYRLNATELNPLYGDYVSKASYLNWVIDYNRQLGVSGTDTLTTVLNNIDVRLCWRTAAFTDKKYLKILTERSSPDSSNTGQILPDESYQLMLYKNQPFEQITYSSVIVQKVSNGWAILGYNQQKPYFNILTSRVSSDNLIIESGGQTVRVSLSHSNTVAQVPYGFVYTTADAVCDFLVSYGAFLKSQGLIFDTRENGYTLNWEQMAREFLTWSQQGWTVGSIINLNPAAVSIAVERPQAVVDNIYTYSPENIILNQNRQPLPSTDLAIDRLDNLFRVRSLSTNTINFINLKFTAYEHMVVLDNRSIFSDLIYQPSTGARQSRILVSGWLTGDWTGILNAPGFVLNQDNIPEWLPTRKYAKGEIVLFKGEYWSASTIIQPSREFNYDLWIKSDYDQIQKGLLPNAAGQSVELAQAYSVYNTNLEEEVNLFSYGLIGFRPRQYMQALNLDDVSQVNLYQQFLKSKGTLQSAELFSLADLNKEVAEYNIFEYWAILKSQYGATANKNFFEILLNQAELPSDPSLVQVIQPGQKSQADQKVLLQDVWKTSTALTSTNILPTTTPNITDIGLPSAGYVNLDDVDLTAFDFEALDNADELTSQIGVGTTIWIAKTNSQDWGIYSARLVPGDIVTVTDNLEGRSRVIFNQIHNLSVGDILVIKFFDPNINGIYRVKSVVDIYSVLIDYQFTGFQTTISGEGIGFTLKSIRVAQPSDIVDLPFAKQLTPGIKVWVDNNGRNQWTVLEKTDPYSSQALIEPKVLLAETGFGTSVTQGFSNLSALVGAPNYNPDNLTNPPGAVYAFVKNVNNEYEQKSILTLTTTDAAGYGNSMDMGDQRWAVVGASASLDNYGYAVVIYRDPSSDVFLQSQILVVDPGSEPYAPDEFGYSVTISQDERWIYVGAPGANKVYAYGRVDYETQFVKYVADGVTSAFNYNNSIQVETSDQLLVALGTETQVLGLNYVVTSTDVRFPVAPLAGTEITISRRTAVRVDGIANSDTTVSIGTGTKTLTVVPAGLDYAAGMDIEVQHDSGNYMIGTVDSYNPVSGVLVIDVTTSLGSGSYDRWDVFTLNRDRYNVSTLYSVDNEYSVGVYVNGSLQRPIIDYTFDAVERDIVLVNPPPDKADILIQARTYFIPVSTIKRPGSGNTVSFSSLTVNSGSTTRTLTVQTGLEYDDKNKVKIKYDDNNYIIGYIVSYNSSTGEMTVAVTETKGSGTYSSWEVLIIDRFGHSVATTTDGRQVIVGCPDVSYIHPVTGVTYVNAGEVYIYDRSVQNIQATENALQEFTALQTLIQPTDVYKNGEFLVNNSVALNGDYSISGNTVTLNSPANVGDIISISTNQFKLLQEIYSERPGNNARFGYVVDQCTNNCSLYVSSPYIDLDVPGAGQVEVDSNQARIYGTITTDVANPSLSINEYIRINNFYVKMTTPVSPGGGLPVRSDIEQLVYNINNAAIPNVTASVTPNLELTGDGITTVFDIGSIYSFVSTYTPRVLVNNELKYSPADYSYDNETQQITFVVPPADRSVITVVSGRMVVSVKNLAASIPFARLQVLPGTGTIFEDLGVPVYAHAQIITAPIQQDYARFGTSLVIGDNATTLFVGAPNGSAIKVCKFDENTTTFDSSSVNFFDVQVQNGVVYQYDSLNSANPSVDNPRQFVFGQQISGPAKYDANGTLVLTYNEFGTSIDYTTGTLLIGAPGTNSIDDLSNVGQVVQLVNENLTPAWIPTRVQQPVVDINMLNTVYMYDRASNLPKQYFDYFDPLQGRLLGAVAQNVDFIGAVDPAAYNVGSLNNYGSRWAQERVGQIWWNTGRVRFIDPNQDDIVYASRRWGQLFPGSSVDVYQWVASTVPPAEYTGPGTPLSTTSYVETSSFNEQGIFATEYYFWVTGINTVNVAAKKTLSIETIARYIESPKSSGISYVAPINASTVAIYNGLEFISAQDTILHVEYDRVLNDAAIHVQYQLIAEDREDGFLNADLYKKMQDSFCGSNEVGSPVPDPFLSPSEKFGVEFRPRQSMFVNRFLALQNYLERANTVVKQFPVSETKKFDLLNSEEPEPSAFSGAWDKRVLNYEELTFQNLAIVPVGYKYLVANDATYRGIWTIYQVVNGALPGSKELALIRVQNYNTKLYWQYIDWFEPGYNSSTRIVAEVPVYSALSTITVPEGSSVKVTSNPQGKWEIYQLISGAWKRVGLQSGTIEFQPSLWNYSIGRFGFDIEVFDAQFYDQEPVIETRKIIQAINQELLVDELSIERNRLLILMFNYIMSEQQAPNWLMKTSLIDVDHTIRQLIPYQSYRKDNQEFVLDYIQEVKPYHTQIREFNLIYEGFDVYQGSATDFDLPAYWNTSEGLFISPVLDNTGTLSPTSSVPSTDAIWQTFPYDQWYQNYLLSIESVTIVDGGIGYTIPPEVVVLGDAEEPAEMVARVNSAGAVIAIDVVNPGFGYSNTATIKFVGGNGSGARAVAVMGNSLVRNIRTVIKYDRYEYNSNVVNWEPNVVYSEGDLVRYADRVWSANSSVVGESFDPQDWTFVPAENLSGVDRTMGYYVPAENQPGLDLSLLISGVDYPGVQVAAPGFDQNAGFDVGRFDINPFDNLAYGPEGRPTYDPSILDAIYTSEFSDPYLGMLPAPAYEGNPPTTGPNPIIVDGGAFVDTYSSHAPEELVPGAIFDTFDIRVFTTPGSDWTGAGHGFPSNTIKYSYNPASTYSFADLVEHPVSVNVWNQTRGVQLAPTTQYNINWVNQTITVVNTAGANSGDIIVITAYALGGGNQIYTQAYNGAEIGDTIIAPISSFIVTQAVVFVNGNPISGVTFSPYNVYETRVQLPSSYQVTDYVVLTLFGTTDATPNYSWSAPVTQYIIATGGLAFSLLNNMEGTNPANLIVEKNGVRARPADGIEYFADGSSADYYLPVASGYSQTQVADNDVSVYVNGLPLILSVGFTVSPEETSPNRYVTLANVPNVGDRILISVRTAAQYIVVENSLLWKASGSLVPIAGDIISVTSWNDTRQQNILTRVFQGPTSQGIQITQGYDEGEFSSSDLNNTPGSFDYSTGGVILTNRFDVGRPITNPNRLVVTLDGIFLFENIGYVIDNNEVVLLGPTINSAQVVAITMFTESVVPEAIGFRIFQDMRGIQTSYRINNATTTELAQAVLATDDRIFVKDVTKLSEPNLEKGIFGLITINGERITYRERNLNNNSVSGLRRGTAGTGAADHAVGAAVYDIGIGNMLPKEYQDVIREENFLADGIEVYFATENIVLTGLTTAQANRAVEVYVGGILQTGGYTVNSVSPVAVIFDQAPTENYQVTIAVKQGLSWYEPGPGTASNGIPLQEQNTAAARFIRGN